MIRKPENIKNGTSIGPESAIATLVEGEQTDKNVPNDTAACATNTKINEKKTISYYFLKSILKLNLPIIPAQIKNFCKSFPILAIQ